MSWSDLLYSHLVNALRALTVLYLFGTLAFFLEKMRPAEPGAKFFKSDFRTELGFPLFNAFVTSPFWAWLAGGLTARFLEPFAPHHVSDFAMREQPLALQVLLLLLVGDLAVYVEHRISHGPLWRFHAIHHAPTEINWLTHARLHPVNVMSIAFAGLLTNFVFGIDGAAIGVTALVANILAVWEHLNLDFLWPRPLRYLLISPNFHRWHHAAENEAVDKNFALIFPLYDVMFGTYYCPERLPHAYGIPAVAETEAAVPAGFSGQLLYPFHR